MNMPLPTVPMTGWDATWPALRDLITERLLPSVERWGNKLWVPEEVSVPKLHSLAFCALGEMRVEAEEQPYPSRAPTFLFLVDGEGFVLVRNTWFHLLAGKGVFVPQECPLFPHGQLGTEVPSSHWLWIAIHSFGAAVHQCQLTAQAHLHGPVYIIVDRRVPKLFREWETETFVRGKENSLVSQGLLSGFLELLREATGLPLITWAELTASLPELPSELYCAVDYIMRAYDKPLRMKQLARFCQKSPSQLWHLFYRYLGTSPSAYVNHVRLKAARQLLTETKLPPKVVSRLVGYANYRHFSAHFRRHFGIDPTDGIPPILPDAKIYLLINKIAV